MRFQATKNNRPFACDGSMELSYARVDSWQGIMYVPQGDKGAHQSARNRQEKTNAILHSLSCLTSLHSLRIQQERRHRCQLVMVKIPRKYDNPKHCLLCGRTLSFPAYATRRKPVDRGMLRTYIHTWAFRSTADALLETEAYFESKKGPKTRRRRG